MGLATIVGLSLFFQLITIYYSLRLIFVTGINKAWLLLSVGLTTMGVRRLMTFIDMLYPHTTVAEITIYEIVGLIGSAIMLGGVIFIKPVFLSIKAAEQEQRKLAEKLQDALSNVKTLKGMLPICASCKKIRDDKGYWNQIESYIHTHTEAEFSHGICPDCARKLYPEIFAEKDK